MGFFDKAESAKVYTSISGSELADIVRETGFVPNLTTDPSGDPLVQFMMEGLNCAIYCYGVKDGRATSLQFTAGFSEKVPHDKVNEWNVKKRFIKAHLDSDGDIIATMDLDIDGGVTRDFFIEALKRWRAMFGKFANYINEQASG